MSIKNLDQYAAELHIQFQRLFFLDITRGTRKTFVTTAIQRFLKSKGKLVVAILSSAVKVQLMDGGCMAHSLLKTPVPAHSERNVPLMQTCSLLVSSAKPILSFELKYL